MGDGCAWGGVENMAGQVCLRSQDHEKPTSGHHSGPILRTHFPAFCNWYRIDVQQPSAWGLGSHSEGSVRGGLRTRQVCPRSLAHEKPPIWTGPPQGPSPRFLQQPR